jgi:menaquinone-dependent protoporphyrinogen oxidase
MPDAARSAADDAAAAPPARRLLVAYASRYGSTAEVAQAIARALRAPARSVDVVPAAQVAAVDGYDAMIVGSAVRFGTWLDEALAFLRRHRTALAARPLAFFTLHMQATASDTGRAQQAAYTSAARAIAVPRDEAFFLGALQPGRLSFLDRMAVRMVGAPLQDLRDWAAIEAWAKALPARLLAD